jgi:hypothetical protein
MVNAKYIDGGASLREFRRDAMRMTGSIRDTALVVVALLWQCGVRRPRWCRRPPRTLGRFNPYRGIGRGDTSAGCRMPEGFLAQRPVLTDRRGRGRNRSRSC